MKHKLLLFAISFLFFSCTTVPKSAVPEWLTDKGRIATFPRDEYIFALASNKSAEIAKQEAAAEISRFIKSEITNEKQHNIVLVKTENDNGDFVSQKVSDILDNNGFSPVQKNAYQELEKILENDFIK